MTKQEVLDKYRDDEFLFADGFDDCILGIDANALRVIYKIEDCVLKLQKEQKISYEEASEYLFFNSITAWVGEKTPIWCE